ncbi:ABC transporter permease subunit [Bacillus sp. OTU530]|uniref:ABC transporter permease subunit n=1 Tax=Bacillus sp. OTU530 TaxID=3043862 RepID=UPI00313B3957
MNVFLREMRATRKSLIIWSISMIVMVAGGMNKYEAISASGQSMNELVSQMPKSLQTIMGMGAFDLSKALGYYGLLFLYLVLMAGIHALTLGATIIVKEERDKTAEFLLAKPISRSGIVTAKLMAACVNLVVLNGITMLTSIQMVSYYSKGATQTHDIIVLMIGMFFLQLIFGALGAGIAAIHKHPKTAVSIGIFILLAMLILSLMIDINSKIEVLKYLTPFQYYTAKQILASRGLDSVFVTLSVVEIALLLLATYVSFNKRDMNV